MIEHDNTNMNGNIVPRNDCDDDDDNVNNNDIAVGLALRTTVTTKHAKVSPSYVLGLFFIFVVSLLWAGSSILVQFMYEQAGAAEEEDDGESSTTTSALTPFLVTYIGVSLFTLWLPVQFVVDSIVMARSLFQKHRYSPAVVSVRRGGIEIHPLQDQRPLTSYSPLNPITTTVNTPAFDRHLDADKFESNGATCSTNNRSVDCVQFEDQQQLTQEQPLQKPLQQQQLRIQKPLQQHQQQCHFQIDKDERENEDGSSSSTSVNNLRIAHASRSSSGSLTNYGTENQQLIIEQREANSIGFELSDTNDLSVVAPLPQNLDIEDFDNVRSSLVWTHPTYCRTAMYIAPVWFIANWAYNASLAYTTITSSTVLASTSSLFTFLFAYLCNDEKYSHVKMVGILLGVLGSIMTTLNDDTTTANHNGGNATITTATIMLNTTDATSAHSAPHEHPYGILGDFLGLVSAVGYGGYAIQTRILCPRDESLYQMQKILGYIGFFCMFSLSPIAFYQLFLRKDVTLSRTTFCFLIIKGLIDNVLSDYLWLRSIILTNATVATVGLGLTIPLAFLSDVVLMGNGSTVLGIFSLVGAVAVLLGFLLVNLGGSDHYDSVHDHFDGDAVTNHHVTRTNTTVNSTSMGSTSRTTSHKINHLRSPEHVPLNVVYDHDFSCDNIPNDSNLCDQADFNTISHDETNRNTV